VGLGQGVLPSFYPGVGNQHSILPDLGVSRGLGKIEVDIDLNPFFIGVLQTWVGDLVNIRLLSLIRNMDQPKIPVGYARWGK